MPGVCKVNNCRRKHALFRLPDDPDLLKKWMQFLNLPQGSAMIKSWKICSHHFEERYIKRNMKRLRLTRSAVPSLHSGQEYNVSDKSDSGPPRHAKCSWQEKSNRILSDTFVKVEKIKEEIEVEAEFINCLHRQDITSNELDQKEPLIDSPSADLLVDP